MSLKKTSAFLFIIFFLGVGNISFGTGFKDTLNDWSEEYVHYMSNEKGILSGYLDSSFKPNKNITRGEIVKVISRYDEKIFRNNNKGNYTIPYDVGNKYSWITNNDWERVIVNDYIKGYPDGSFKPDHGITRGEFASIVYSMKEYENNIPEEKYDVNFLDMDNHWSKDFVKDLANRGIISGFEDNTFRPDEYITRGQVAKILSTFNGKVGEVNLNSYVNVRGTTLRLGERESLVREKLGEPDAVGDSPYGYVYNVYNKDYNKFVVLGMGSGKVKMIYTGIKGFDTKYTDDGISLTNLSEYTLTRKGIYTRDYGGHNETCFVEGDNNNRVYAVAVQDKDSIFNESPSYMDHQKDLLFDMINSYRVKHNLNPLKKHNLAYVVAQKHSEDMALNNYFDHVSKSGATVVDRYLLAGGTKKVGIGEVIGAGNLRAITNLDSYINSKEHREVILHPRLTHAGVGMSYNANSEYKYYNVIDILINPYNTN